MDTSNIFKNDGLYKKDIDLAELLLALASPTIPLSEKREIWDCWCYHYFDESAVKEFLADTPLFSDNGEAYLNAMLQAADHKNFYEMAMSLDLAGLDPKLYYIYWILMSPRSTEKGLLKEAIEYDPETILAICPYVKEVIFGENAENK